jgi:hypothetical protein
MNDLAICPRLGTSLTRPIGDAIAGSNIEAASQRAGSSATARSLGAATLGIAAIAALLQIRRAAAGCAAKASAAQPEAKPATATAPDISAGRASRTLHASAALLATSVLTDSAVEHYRGQFENPGMFAPLGVSLLTALAGSFGAASRAGASPVARNGIYASALAVGAVGSAFHVYNVLRRPGGISWGNLFYAAPLGAPAALSLAGLLGLAARHVHNTRDTPDGSNGSLVAPRRLVGLPAGHALSALTSAGLAGTTAEVALLHFRGAFHNPFMWLPISVPPVAAGLLGAAAIAPVRPRLRRFIRFWLALTGLLGIGGVGFHAYGVGRQMGGWRNWSQNVLSGPPLSAPPSYAALALAGFAALRLLDQDGSSQGATS